MAIRQEKRKRFQFPCSCINCHLLDITLYEASGTFKGTKPQILKWREYFNIFCCYQDSEFFDLMSQQYNTYELQELLQAIIVHQFVNCYLISQDYFFLYADKIIQHRIPLVARVFGEEIYIREDEKFENFLSPSDLFSVVIPRFWKEVFYNEIVQCDKYVIVNVEIKKAVCDNLLRDPTSTTTLPRYRTEAYWIGLVEKNEGRDKLPP